VASGRVTLELHHRLDGPPDAPVVLLSNSLGTALEMWDGQVPAMAAHFRVLRYDQRGHGRSPTPGGPYSIDDLGGDALALLDSLGLERVSVCGVSLGGMTGMWLAIHARERVERLALCCTSAHLPPAETWTERAAAVRAGGMEAVVDSVLERWFTPEGARRRAEAVERTRRMLLATPPEGYAASCEAIAALDLRARLGDVRAPTLVLTASDDPSTPPEHGRLIADAIPGGRFVVLPGARHMVSVERAGAVTAALLEHLLDEDPFRRGMRIRREVLGDAYVDAAVERTSGFTSDFQDLITRYAWGDVWARPELDRRTRSAITLAALVALGRLDELELHLRAARRNGMSADEIGEVLLHSAVYCGVPAANAAFTVAQRVLESDESGD
jgi:3-oxoadipate enol-lactonase / 4-carboxymuconolactone decarboxylase